MLFSVLVTVFLARLCHAALSASCSPTLSAVYPIPSTAKGYVIRLVANNLTLPRAMKFDTQGRLLVVERGIGVSALTLTDNGGGCIQATSKKVVVAQESLNHGLELSPDGQTLYASDPSNAYSWTYSASAQAVTSSSTLLVYGMNGTMHITRTLYLSKTAPGMMVVSRGSNADVDWAAEYVSSGSAQVRAFDLTDTSNIPYNWSSSGTVMGYALRNDVGVDEEPTTGGLFSVENGMNFATRSGVSIRNGNPAEELNFLGYVGGTPSSPNMGANFGYPECFTVWNTSIPDFKGKTGQVIGWNKKNDTFCATKHQAPVQAFAGHSAPIDILFNDAGTNAWITFRGSDTITPSTGYGVGYVQFSQGQPVAPLSSRTAMKFVSQPTKFAQCSKKSCWAPTSLAWDSQGRLFMSTDYTGEIYVILRSDGTGPNS